MDDLLIRMCKIAKLREELFREERDFELAFMRSEARDAPGGRELYNAFCKESYYGARRDGR